MVGALVHDASARSLVSALDALAERCGIEASFRDARGATRRTGAGTQQALLGAMGISADEPEAALAALDDAEWQRALPPVCVRYRGAEPVSIDLVLAAGAASISWHLVLEAGGERRGAARFERLELIEKRDSTDGRQERRRLVLNGKRIPFGYHRLTLEPGGAQTVLIITPGQCWLPSQIAAGKRLWGAAAQLYLLRSARNWGIGDYGDLHRLVKMLARRGADVVGLNPLHALFLDDPEHASPYAPASRLLLNALNIDIAGLPETAECAEARDLIRSESFQSALRRCRDAPLVDYSGVAALKLPLFDMLFACCRSQPDSLRWREFEAFRRDAGSTLERGCLFEALREHFAASDPRRAGWHCWPDEYRNPGSHAVTRFAEEHADRVTFHAWLQFVADDQLGTAADAAKRMAVGLYRDLAIGADPEGAETWASQKAVVAAAQVGAPPDIYNPGGQDWGLPPFDPRALREEAYRSFIDLVRANMRHAGGLRIDHVMGLQQLYWVPQGKPPAEGAYVRYPLDDLVGILALESRRNRCLVVGEDLGTVPEGFRERMAAANILSYRVLFFEKASEGFRSPDQYPTLALAVAGSHDLPTLRAWWEAGDLRLKEQLNLFPKEEDARRAWEERESDRRGLLDALHHAGLDSDPEMGVEALSRAVHAFLARSASAFAVVQVDDITDESAPVNVPTTSDEHPNWRRRLSMTLEELDEHPRFAALADIFRRQRSRAPLL